MFTAGEVFRSIVLLAPRLRSEPPDPMVVASAFNAALADLVSDVVDADPERLAAKYTLPDYALDSDPVDLTAAGTEANPSSREWLRILYIDWEADGRGDEVWITTLEARGRALHEYPGRVVGYLTDNLRKLHKVAGWDNVTGLTIYGVLAPEEVLPRTFEKKQFDYPRSMKDALRWDMLLQLAPYAGADAQTVGYWEAKRQEARDRLFADVHGHIESRIEDQPLIQEWY